eukprot:124882-Pyramimonas_sp.AAC.1
MRDLQATKTQGTNSEKSKNGTTTERQISEKLTQAGTHAGGSGTGQEKPASAVTSVSEAAPA